MKKNYLLLAGIILLASCTKTFQEPTADDDEISTAAGGNSNHESATFGESGMIDLGESGAALFVLTALTVLDIGPLGMTCHGLLSLQ